ncbi:MAG: hypothetical protein ACFE0P_09060 [Oceanicaulis sp.]
MPNKLLITSVIAGAAGGLAGFGAAAVGLPAAVSVGLAIGVVVGSVAVVAGGARPDRTTR